jgi:hypothetical protein
MTPSCCIVSGKVYVALLFSSLRDQISELSFSWRVPTINASFIRKIVMLDVFLVVIV